MERSSYNAAKTGYQMRLMSTRGELRNSPMQTHSATRAEEDRRLANVLPSRSSVSASPLRSVQLQREMFDAPIPDISILAAETGSGSRKDAPQAETFPEELVAPREGIVIAAQDSCSFNILGRTRLFEQGTDGNGRPILVMAPKPQDLDSWTRLQADNFERVYEMQNAVIEVLNTSGDQYIIAFHASDDNESCKPGRVQFNGKGHIHGIRLFSNPPPKDWFRRAPANAVYRGLQKCTRGLIREWQQKMYNFDLMLAYLYLRDDLFFIGPAARPWSQRLTESALDLMRSRKFHPHGLPKRANETEEPVADNTTEADMFEQLYASGYLKRPHPEDNDDGIEVNEPIRPPRKKRIAPSSDRIELHGIHYWKRDPDLAYKRPPFTHKHIGHLSGMEKTELIEAMLDHFNTNDWNDVRVGIGRVSDIPERETDGTNETYMTRTWYIRLIRELDQWNKMNVAKKSIIQNPTKPSKDLDMHERVIRAIRRYDQRGTAYLSPIDTARFMDYVFAENTQSPMFLKDCMELLFRGKRSKKNAVYMWGASNAGKSKIAQMFVSLFDTVGDYSGELSNFPYQNLPDKDCGFFDDFVITEPHMNKFKLLAEGARTTVDIKGRAPEYVENVPIFVTSNKPIDHQLQAVDADAIRNRCIEMSGMLSVREIRKFDGKELHPQYVEYIARAMADDLPLPEWLSNTGKVVTNSDITYIILTHLQMVQEEENLEALHALDEAQHNIESIDVADNNIRDAIIDEDIIIE